MFQEQSEHLPVVWLMNGVGLEEGPRARDPDGGMGGSDERRNPGDPGEGGGSGAPWLDNVNFSAWQQEAIVAPAVLLGDVGSREQAWTQVQDKKTLVSECELRKGA